MAEIPKSQYCICTLHRHLFWFMVCIEIERIRLLRKEHFLGRIEHNPKIQNPEMKNYYIGRLAIIRQRFPSNLAHPKVNLLDCCQQMNDINFSFPYRNSLLRGEMRKKLSFIKPASPRVPFLWRLSRQKGYP